MRSQTRGWVMAVTGASLWGLSGTAAQKLFQEAQIDPVWLVTVRLIVAGLLLLAAESLRRSPAAVWSVWKDRRDRKRLILFGVFGMLGAQYTYFASIAAGNAATATLLQFLGPVFIVVYTSLRMRRLPSRNELSALALACAGTFLLITNGSLGGLSVSAEAVAWGIAAGVTAAFYMVYPSDMLNKWGSASVVGWGMAVGGVGLSLWSQPWTEGVRLTPPTFLLIGFVVLFGTLLPFFLLLESLRHIPPSQAGCLSSAEPLTAALASVFWLHAPMGLFEALGGICIVATVLLLSRTPQAKPAAPDRQLSAPS